VILKRAAILALPLSLLRIHTYTPRHAEQQHRLLECFACALHTDLPKKNKKKGEQQLGNDLLSFFMGENVVNLFLLLRNACMMNILSHRESVQKKRETSPRSFLSFRFLNGEEESENNKSGDKKLCVGLLSALPRWRN